jgi:hypothetical protein
MELLALVIGPLIVRLAVPAVAIVSALPVAAAMVVFWSIELAPPVWATNIPVVNVSVLVLVLCTVAPEASVSELIVGVAPTVVIPLVARTFALDVVIFPPAEASDAGTIPLADE